MSYSDGSNAQNYSHPLVHGKGTRRNSEIGPHCASRSKKGVGKSDIIAGTFGEGWLNTVEERLSKRRLACTKCGRVREAGVCPDPCGYSNEFGGW